MGIYINPPNVASKAAKVAYIAERSKPITASEFRAWEPGKEGKFAVCVVDNGPFNAAGVAYDKREAEAFTTPEEWRPQQFFLMPLEAMRGCLPDRHEKQLAEICSRRG
jgi:hypothetical protein